MQQLSRTRLASLTCLSAPFLAPRLLRATVPLVGPAAQLLPCSAGSQRPGFATKSKGKGVSRRNYLQTVKRSQSVKETGDNSKDARLIGQFREACEIRNVHKVMDLYPALLEAGLLTQYDTRRITQSLHVRIRNIHTDSQRSDFFPFVQQVATDLRTGILPPHPYAFVHLFGIYKDCKRYHEGNELWQWLALQDEPYVSQAAYGAAIELMAYGGLMDLPSLEDLYLDGLKRFPGTFAEYHLSPDAIIPDRTQPTAISRIPIILLQGILTARMLAGDWKRAYLALDTALRLYPTQTPSRFFELFMTERPIAEAYTAFMLACRAGVTLRPTHVTALITKMRAAIGAFSSMTDRMMTVRAIANALYAHVQAGGQLESIHVGAFVHSLEQLLPELVAGQDYEGEAAEARNVIALAAHETMSGLIQAGMAPQLHPFEALISLAGKLRVPNLLTTTLQDVAAADIQLGPIGTRSAITSAGLLGNKYLIEQLWERVVSVAEEASAQIPFQDWITLTKACRRAGHVEYFQQQLRKLPHTITESVETHLVQQIDQIESATNDRGFRYLSLDVLISEIDALKTQLKSIEAVVMSGQPLDFRKSPFYMNLDPDAESLGSSDALRTIYNERNTDPHQPPPPLPADGSSVPVAVSSTGIPLDQLRFQNWVTLLEMMDLAQEYDSAFRLTLDAAIKAGKPIKGNAGLLRLRKDHLVPERSIEDLRIKISDLRTSHPRDESSFRKVGLEDSYKSDAHNPTTRKTNRQSVSRYPDRTPQQQETRGAPRISYYVGLESDHDAPTNVREAKAKTLNAVRKVVTEEQSTVPSPPITRVRDSPSSSNIDAF